MIQQRRRPSGSAATPSATSAPGSSACGSTGARASGRTSRRVPIDTIQQMLDHLSPAMTAVYATIKHQTLREKFDRYQELDRRPRQRRARARPRRRPAAGQLPDGRAPPPASRANGSTSSHSSVPRSSNSAASAQRACRHRSGRATRPLRQRNRALLARTRGCAPRTRNSGTGLQRRALGRGGLRRKPCRHCSRGTAGPRRSRDGAQLADVEADAWVSRGDVLENRSRNRLGETLAATAEDGSVSSHETP